MITINPFSELYHSSPMAMQIYVVLMVLLVVEVRSST